MDAKGRGCVHAVDRTESVSLCPNIYMHYIAPPLASVRALLYRHRLQLLYRSKGGGTTLCHPKPAESNQLPSAKFKLTKSSPRFSLRAMTSKAKGYSVSLCKGLGDNQNLQPRSGGGSPKLGECWSTS